MDELTDLLGELNADQRAALLAQVRGPIVERRLAAELDAATDTHRAEQTDESRAAYRAANDALVSHRRQMRAGRTGVGVGGDAVMTRQEQ
jgi:hypothetical protein